MTATDAQVRIIMRERSKGKTQEQAAAKANLGSRKTVGKYEKTGRLPSELKQPRKYRTREDPFADVWSSIEKMLEDAKELEGKAIFDWLCEQKPGKYQEGQLRTFQRRVSTWKALHTEKMLCLDQVRQPGKMMQTDGTWMNKLGITIEKQPFRHMLIHSVLPYSNWEWGKISQSESLLAIRNGVQHSLFKLGYVPEIHQTDNSTAATHVPGAEQKENGEKRVFSKAYVELMDHFGMKPETIHIGQSDENGDVEAANGALKKAIRQHLMLRGSTDFESIAIYEAFLEGIMDKRNALRLEKLQDEIAVMRPLQVNPYPEMREYRPKVNRSGIIRVQKNGYSVPSGLKGKIVSARVFEWWIEVWYANKLVETLPRIIGEQKYQVNYRHVIHTLLRKPGGFRNYRHFQSLFPSEIFRKAYEQLQNWYAPRKAELIYLRVLKLAADLLETDVSYALEILCTAGEKWDDQSVADLVQPEVFTLPQLKEVYINLADYDALLQTEVAYV